MGFSVMGMMIEAAEADAACITGRHRAGPDIDRHAIDAGNPVYPGAWTAPDGSSYPPSIFGMKNTSAPGGTN
jgi:hypothetical protein